MDSRRGTARTYEDFDPVVEWKVGDHGQDIVEITLQGFRKEHVRVQVDNQRVLRATGERPGRGGKWVRFTKDLRLPDNCDADGVRAKFEDEKLIITLPIVAPDGELPPATSPVHETPPSSPPRPVPEQDTIVTQEPKPSPPHKETPATVPETEMWGTEIGVSPPSPPPHPPIEQEETKKEDHPPIEQEETKKEDHPPIEQEETKKEDSKVQEKVDKEDDMEPPTVIEPPMVATAKTMRALLVNMAAAVVVLVGIALSVWHTLRSKQD